MNFNTLY